MLYFALDMNPLVAKALTVAMQPEFSQPTFKLHSARVKLKMVRYGVVFTRL